MALVPVKRRERQAGEAGKVLEEMDDLTLQYFEFISGHKEKNDGGWLVRLCGGDSLRTYGTAKQS